MSLFIFILVLVVLILVHELGHFAVAKLFKIKVEEFGIFFPPRIAGWKIGETLYSINWLPFGGFVRIFGEHAAEDAPKEARDPGSFVHRSRWIQAAVIVAGIAFNILFAWLALSAGYLIGLPTSAQHDGWGTVQNPETLITQVVPGSPAEAAGIEAGDAVRALQTGSAQLAPGADAAATQAFIAAHQDESFVITLGRNGTEEIVLAKAKEGLIEGRKAIGVELDDVGTLRLPPHTALLQGALMTERMTVAVTTGLYTFFSQIVRGAANFADVAGPIGIAGIGSMAVDRGLAAIISLAAFISINLAVINLLPIPGLDGGRLLFIAIEGIRGRAISPRVAGALTIAGFALLIALMIVVTYHDLVKLM